MTRLSILIADTDGAYLESLSDVLTNNYSKRFRTSIFTNVTALEIFLNNSDTVTDILLISPELYSAEIKHGKINTIIVLSAGRLSFEMQKCNVINRYQHINVIVREIINYYSQKNQNEILSTPDSKKAKVMAVYSPSGGAGKTSVAMCSSICCIQKGLSVFYLSFENFHSSGTFLEEDKDQNLSKIIYCLKENKTNLNLKIEATRSIDSVLKVHYFSPPDSALEIDELKPEGIKNLISTIRKLSQYDLIFIDMPSSFNKNSIAIFEECDEIFLVLTQESHSIAKYKLFLNELDILSEHENLFVSEKIRVINNKSHTDMVDIVDIAGKESARIPYYNSIVEPSNILSKNRFSEEFSLAIEKMLRGVDSGNRL